MYIVFCLYPLLNPSVSSRQLNDANEFVYDLVNGGYSGSFVLVGDMTDVKGAFNGGSDFYYGESMLPMYNFRVFPETKEYMIEAQSQGRKYREPMLVFSTVSFFGTEFIFQVFVVR